MREVVDFRKSGHIFSVSHFLIILHTLVPRPVTNIGGGTPENEGTEMSENITDKMTAEKSHYDEDGSISLPPVGYVIATVWLTEKYNGFVFQISRH